MKRGLILALAGLIGAGSLLGEGPKSSRTLEESISREVSKLDSWAGSSIESDYTKPSTNGKIKIAIQPKRKQADTSRAGYYAYYNPPSQEIVLTSQEYESDSLAHELEHVVYNVMMKNPGEIKPTLAEIQQYHQKRIKDHQFKPLKDLIQIQTKAYKMFAEFLMNSIENGVSEELARSLSQSDSWRLYSTKEEAASIDSIERALHSRNNAYRQERTVIAKAQPEYKRLADLFDSTGNPDHIARMDGIISDASTKIWQLSKSFQDIRSLHEKLNSLHKIALKRERSSRTNRYGLDMETETLFDIQRSTREETLRTRMAHEQDALEFNIQQTGYIVHNPDEFMARAVASLYNLHFGPSNLSHFELKEEDLEFLLKFEKNGVKLYPKGVLKYAIAMKMIASGMKPQEARSALEYAKEISFENTNYKFPETKFDIKGKIPESTSNIR